MTTSVNLQRARTGLLRYRILAILHISGTIPVGETLFLTILSDLPDEDLDVTPDELRRALRYLADKAYIELEAPRDRHWKARLLPRGVDYIERNLEDDPGITRPPR